MVEKVKTKKEEVGKLWSIQKIWNDTIVIPRDRAVKPRNYVYASEIGRDFYEVFLSMKGVEPTDGFTDTARRKMEAGNFYEDLVAWVFQRTGILINREGYVKCENPIPVHGRYDIWSGTGGVDWDTKEKELENVFKIIEELNFDFPFIDRVKTLSFSLLKNLRVDYPDGLSDKIYEVKSLNSRAFWQNNEPISKPYYHHIMQATFYKRFNDIGVDDTAILYVDRDTMSISELPVSKRKDIYDEMDKWLQTMAYYYHNGIEPNKPDFIVWSDLKEKWVFNWEIERSKYQQKIMEGVDKKDIDKEIKEKNAKLKRESLMDSAMKGDHGRYGVKKYINAIKLLNDGENAENVKKKTNVCDEDIEYYKQIKNNKTK